MGGSRARRASALAVALALLLAWPLLDATAARAQAPGPQLVVERPAADSVVRGNVVIGGWAADPTAPLGTGIVPDAVEIWLGAADSGQLVGTAGYGDPRPDVVQQLGNARFLASGFRYFWNACDVPPGPNTLVVRARSARPGQPAVTTQVPIVVEPCTIAFGETVDARLSTAGETGRWTFEGTAGERVAITLDGVGDWDTLVELLAPDGSREDLDDDSGYNLNSWLSRRLAQTGTYTIVVRPFSADGCTGDYLLLGWMGPPGTSDPNVAASNLGTTADVVFRGSLREFGERQEWRFAGRAGDELILYAVRSLGSRFDPLVELLGPDGLLLARDDDSGGGLNSFLQGVLPQDGEYTLAIRSARDDCAGEYLLTLENGWGEQSVQRGPLPLQTEVSGALSVASGARRDVWSFPATAGQRMTLILDTDGPTRVQVANPSGDWEVVKSTRGRGLGVTFEPSQTGTYEAVVFADTSRPIQYRLTLEPGLGRLISDKGPVPLGQRVEGEIRYAEARDRYTFEGRQGQRVRITLDRPGRSQLDPYLELLDPDGRTLAEDDDSGGDLNSLIDVTLPRTGTYTVVARGLGDTTGPYVLTVTLSGGEPTPTPSPSPSPTPTGPPATPSPTPTRGPAPPSPTPGPR
ncbi:MAG TPA: PPC domain-containing protein [Chloroflexota bacterium]|jgi:hypothetical protein|nr:PPC domain-containing protein [Chloroflexota bacterium]